MYSDVLKKLFLRYVVYFWYSAVFLSAASVVFGIVSWIILPKWRQFRNYVFLCLLFNNALGVFYRCPYIGGYLALTFIHWLVITTVMFYIEFVNIYTSLNSIKYKYINANVFGWLLPAGEIGLSFILNKFSVYVIIVYALIFMNLVVYLNVLFALCKPSALSSSGQSTGKNVILSTFAFIVTGSYFIVWGVIIHAIDVSPSARTLSILLAHTIVILLINIFFLVLRSHRELWKEHRQRMRSCKLSSENIV